MKTEKRQAKSARIRDKYPDRIPVIVEKAGRTDVPEIDENSLTMAWLNARPWSLLPPVSLLSELRKSCTCLVAGCSTAWSLSVRCPAAPDGSARSAHPRAGRAPAAVAASWRRGRRRPSPRRRPTQCSSSCRRRCPRRGRACGGPGNGRGRS